MIKSSTLIGCIAPLVLAYAPFCAAQTGECTADVKIVSIGVPLDDTKLRNRNLTQYRYKIDVTTSEKQCAVVSFNVRRSYKQADGSMFSDSQPATLRMRGGKGSNFGEVGDKRGLPKMEWTAEDLSCKRC